MSIVKNYLAVDGATGMSLTYYVCDTDAEKPVTGLVVGDSCFCKDNNKTYVATSATAWVEKGASATTATFNPNLQTSSSNQTIPANSSVFLFRKYTLSST